MRRHKEYEPVLRQLLRGAGLGCWVRARVTRGESVFCRFTTYGAGMMDEGVMSPAATLAVYRHTSAALQTQQALLHVIKN